MNRGEVVVAAGLIGAATGVHAMTGIASLAWRARNGRLLLKATPFRVLARPTVLRLLVVMAGGEMVADKVPGVPDRTSAGPLLGRVAIGSLAGGIVSVPLGNERLAGILAGGVAALISTLVSYRWRMVMLRRLRIPNLLAGVMDDMLAVQLAPWAGKWA